MADQQERNADDEALNVLTHQRFASGHAPNRSGGGGGGGAGGMEQRIAVLEEGMKDIKSTLKEIRDAQQSATLKAAEQNGSLNTRLAEFGADFSSIDTKFAEAAGKLATLNEVAVGLRRDLEKLPSKFDVASIMITVIGGLGAAALLIKNIWPAISKLFGP